MAHVVFLTGYPLSSACCSMFRIIAWLGKIEKLTQCYVNESFTSNTYLGNSTILGWIFRLCIPYKHFAVVLSVAWPAFGHMRKAPVVGSSPNHLQGDLMEPPRSTYFVQQLPCVPTSASG